MARRIRKEERNLPLDWIVMREVQLSMCSSEDYKSDCHNRGDKVVNELRLVGLDFTKVLNFNTKPLEMQSQKYEGRISGKIARWAKRIYVQMRSTNFKLSDAFPIASFFPNRNMACHSNVVHVRATMWLF